MSNANGDLTTFRQSTVVRNRIASFGYLQNHYLTINVITVFVFTITPPRLAE